MFATSVFQLFHQVPRNSPAFQPEGNLLLCFTLVQQGLGAINFDHWHSASLIECVDSVHSHFAVFL